MAMSVVHPLVSGPATLRVKGDVGTVGDEGDIVLPLRVCMKALFSFFKKNKNNVAIVHVRVPLCNDPFIPPVPTIPLLHE